MDVMTRNVKKIILSSIITLLVSAGLTTAADLLSHQVDLLPGGQTSEMHPENHPLPPPLPCADSNVR